METRTLKIALVPEGKPIFDESVTTIEIQDDAAGEYVEIQRINDDVKPGAIKIGPEEWPALRDAIQRMLDECRI